MSKYIVAILVVMVSLTGCRHWALHSKDASCLKETYKVVEKSKHKDEKKPKKEKKSKPKNKLGRSKSKVELVDPSKPAK